MPLTVERTRHQPLDLAAERRHVRRGPRTIVADGEGPAYPGIPNHEPDIAKGRKAADTVHRCMNELRAVASSGGAYVSESNFFESEFEHSYWGANHARLAEIKKKYDPDGLFFVHNGVGSEQWTPDGFTRL